MGDIIRFPLERRQQGILPPPEPTPERWTGNITLSGALVSECTELVHNFDSVPGYCRCGERYWDPDRVS